MVILCIVPPSFFCWGVSVIFIELRKAQEQERIRHLELISRQPELGSVQVSARVEPNILCWKDVVSGGKGDNVMGWDNVMVRRARRDIDALF